MKTEALRGGDRHAREHGHGLLKIAFYPNEGIDFSRESDRYYFSFAAVFYSSLMKFEFTMFKMFLGSLR